MGEAAADAVREARAKQQKRLKAGLVAGGADEMRRVSKEMERRVEEGKREVKSVVDGVKRALERA